MNEDVDDDEQGDRSLELDEDEHKVEAEASEEMS
jgi:hypothetical protein